MSVFFLLLVLESIYDVYIISETVFSISATIYGKQNFYLCTTGQLCIYICKNSKPSVSIQDCFFFFNVDFFPVSKIKCWLRISLLGM